LSAAAHNVSALFDHAVALFATNRLAEAEENALRVLQKAPDFVHALHLLGAIRSRRGNHAEGLKLIDAALRIEPESAALYNSRGNILVALQRFNEALASFESATTLDPRSAVAFGNRGSVLRELGQFDAAITSYEKAIALDPNDAEAFYNRGGALEELQRFDEAVASYDRAIARKPDYAEAFSNRGTALQALGRLSEAIRSYNQAIALQANFPEALCNRGTAFHKMKNFDEAIASYDEAISLKPDFAEAFNYRGLSFHELARFDEALASYDKAITFKPDYAEAFQNRGILLQRLKRFEEALSSYNDAIARKPDYPEAFNNRGAVLKNLQRLEEALASYQQAFTIAPAYPYALSGLADIALRICDWTLAAELSHELKTHIAQKRSIIQPFVLLGYSSDEVLQLKCAQDYTRDRLSVVPDPLWKGTIWYHNKIRLAYLSADFHQHATAHLIAELIERHDRSRFEVLGISFGIDDKSEMRSRLVNSFDQFHNVRFEGDYNVAKAMHALQIDIAIDLKGHTQDARPGILAYRPAPIQVNYLGYPGTIGAQFIDYVIGDEIVLPFKQQPYYTEKIVHLPDCYQVNGTQRKSTDRQAIRHQEGLPENAFVFCCFNNNYKITAEVFEVWMRLLKAIDGSVLWLLRDNDVAEKNLRKAAATLGIAPERLVFAARTSMENHLARHGLADLFLDTLPYNAHTTASDALWGGLPIVTCCGESFAGRVATSLLTAIGLPELATQRLDEYEALALRLARDAPLLKGIKFKLARNRETHPLFNTNRFTRHLEAAYLMMWEIWQRGEKPRSFAVAKAPDV
jgi:protein O-GlcNAc transferase